jgi:hypothetical protein
MALYVSRQQGYMALCQQTAWRYVSANSKATWRYVSADSKTTGRYVSADKVLHNEHYENPNSSVMKCS